MARSVTAVKTRTNDSAKVDMFTVPAKNTAEIHMIYIGISASIFAVFMLVRKMLKENEREQHALEVFNRNVNR